MKSFILAAALAALAGGAMAEPLVGTWQTQPNDEGLFALVEFRPCGGALCGTMVASYDSAGKKYASANIGKDLVWDMQDVGGGEYKNGKIWDPSSDRTYRSKMKLMGNSLVVSGCIGPICKGQNWKRVK